MLQGTICQVNHSMPNLYIYYLLPKAKVNVTEAMVKELIEIRAEPYNKQRKDVIRK